MEDVNRAEEHHHLQVNLAIAQANQTLVQEGKRRGVIGADIFERLTETVEKIPAYLNEKNIPDYRGNFQ